MPAWIVLFLSTIWGAVLCMDMKFPPGFKFGVATSAYQIEGAWNASGIPGLNDKKTPVFVCYNLTVENKNLHAAARLRARELSYKFVWVRGERIYVRKTTDSEPIYIRNMDVLDKGENVWDNLLHHHPELTPDHSNGDVACNSYYLWKTDIQMVHELGLHFYRFSISWTRILPTGFPDRVSKDAVKYYNKLIDGLLKKGIEPIITLYHFDMPLSIHYLGGWANPLIADWFTDYAEIVFSLFADRVKTWITINEPLIICDTVFNSGNFAPRLKEPVLGPYLCNKNVLMAHAKVWRLYDAKYKTKYNGKLSIANNPFWLEPATKEDEKITELAREFAIGRYSHPIYSPHGGWPPAVEKLMKEYSQHKGFPYSRLPSFSEDEKKFIQGTYDFYLLNHYTSRLVRTARPGETIGDWFLFGSPELGIVLETNPKWALEEWKLLAMKPSGIRQQIAWIKDHFNVTILITENGYASVNPKLNDTGRIEFLQEYLTQVLLAIKEDGADLIGYTYWSLMDNFEWMLGQTIKFGLYHVDFTHPLRTRTPRASAHYYAHVIKHHALDVPMKTLAAADTAKLFNTGNSCYSLRLLLFVSIYCLFRL